ncbi:MAG TPA: histidine kinase [Desulfobacteria bacterium]|nr:histidine kinase [Desulfobacteria bacterium]
MYKTKEEAQRALDDLRSRLPAHSLKPRMMQELEELEELVEKLPPAAQLNGSKHGIPKD